MLCWVTFNTQLILRFLSQSCAGIFRLPVWVRLHDLTLITHPNHLQLFYQATYHWHSQTMCGCFFGCLGLSCKIRRNKPCSTQKWRFIIYLLLESQASSSDLEIVYTGALKDGEGTYDNHIQSEWFCLWDIKIVKVKQSLLFAEPRSPSRFVLSRSSCAVSV